MQQTHLHTSLSSQLFTKCSSISVHTSAPTTAANPFRHGVFLRKEDKQARASLPSAGAIKLFFSCQLPEVVKDVVRWNKTQQREGWMEGCTVNRRRFICYQILPALMGRPDQCPNYARSIDFAIPTGQMQSKGVLTPHQMSHKQSAFPRAVCLSFSSRGNIAWNNHLRLINLATRQHQEDN